MVYDFSWDPNFLEPVVSISATAIGLIGYWFTIHSLKLKNLLIRWFGEERTAVNWVITWRIVGFFFYVVIPASLLFPIVGFPPERYGLSFVNLGESLIWILAISTALIIAQSSGARHPSNYKIYPQIRVRDWTPRIYFVNLFAWFLYMLSYEFLFRGILLFGTVHILGVWPAIVINVAIYAIAHIPKGSKETWLAIPFGLAICFLTLKTNTIWIAVFVHMALASSNDYFAIKANPEMQFKFKK